MQCLQPAVLNVETSFDLAEWQRKRVLYRLDGGSGTDKNLTWLLKRGYQVLSKGFSGRRARALATHVSRWDPYAEDRWIGWVEPTFDLGRPVKVLVKRKWLRIPVKTITYSGRCRSLRPDDADHLFRLMAITQERDNAGNKIIPLVVTCDQRRMKFSHRFSFQF